MENWKIPGTTLVAPRREADRIEDQFGAMFLAGGMVLSQVTSVTGLDAYMIQNWVKRGFLAKPVQKRYTLRQLCRIININMLKGILPMERICSLLSYINGQLDDESDDLIDDSQLYFIFVRLAAQADLCQQQEHWDDAIRQMMRTYQEPFPGARDRVEKVLRIMLTAWVASCLQQRAEAMFQDLNS